MGVTYLTKKSIVDFLCASSPLKKLNPNENRYLRSTV